MRVIDADDFKRFMQALCKAGSPYESFIELLDKQTTAYDIDKVVKELSNADPQEMMSEEQRNVLNYAIEIVKQSGF